MAAGLAVPVLVKCEHLNPGGSVKDRIALAIVDDAERRGVLRPGDTIVEATAGNTGVGLALVAGARGYRARLRDAREDVARQARLARGARRARRDHAERAARRSATTSSRSRGASPPSTAGSSPTSSATRPIRSCTSRRPGPRSSPRAAGRIGAFVAGAGTGGTITGVGRFLRRACPGARVVLADPLGSGLADWVERGVAGPDTGYLIEGIGAGAPPAVMDRAVIDAAERIPDAESFAMVGRLLREEGLLVGGSAGTAVAAALRVARAGGLDGPVVAVLPDSWDRYLSTAWLQALCSASGILEIEDAIGWKARICRRVVRPRCSVVCGRSFRAALFLLVALVCVPAASQAAAGLGLQRQHGEPGRCTLLNDIRHEHGLSTLTGSAALRGCRSRALRRTCSSAATSSTTRRTSRSTSASVASSRARSSARTSPGARARTPRPRASSACGCTRPPIATSSSCATSTGSAWASRRVSFQGTPGAVMATADFSS